MSPLPGFSENQFRTRSDLIRAALALVQPLDQYKSSHGARVKIATSTGAGFSETAAQLEGFARPLWVVAELLRLQSQNADADLASTSVRLETWIEGLKYGTDPDSPEYWGELSSFDQRMVEMESIAFALLSNPEVFSFSDDEKARRDLIAWLRQINEHEMPQNNWLWFRVLVNLALVKALGVPLDEVKIYIEDALETLDTFYISDGWSSDGLWGEDRKQADYYSGSFAIQLAQLLYVRFAPDYDPIRTEKYKSRARDFAKDYWRYFAPEGAAIPFGRSLTYRFAFAAFWAAAAFAGVDLPAPVDNIGTVKGLLLRHLRWWAQQPHIFNTDGTLNIGYAYPNMYLAENYNSPQSVYWCLKSFLVLGLDESHPFWTCEELLHPLKEEQGTRIAEVKVLGPPRHIMCNTPQHTFLISLGQSTTKRFKAREAKYGKFAYSSAFAFSVPCGPFLEQIAPDSTLAVCLNDDVKVFWDPYDVKSGEINLVIDGETEAVSTLVGSWRPWRQESLVVRATLVASVKRWPGWSLRIHRVEWNAQGRGASELRLVDGGFAASAQTASDMSIFEQSVKTAFVADAKDAVVEGWWSDGNASLVISESGASGVVDLTSDFIQDAPSDSVMQSTSRIIRADPNTNLIAQRSLIPAVEHRLQPSEQFILTTFVTGVFAVEASAKTSTIDTWNMWKNRPKSRVVATSEDEQL